MGRLFGTNGIRGVVNKDLTVPFVAEIGMAVGEYFGGGDLIVGCDGRISSPMLKSAVIGGLTSVGCDVFDVGMAPTPAIQYAIKTKDIDGGVVVTASHNPPEYNGIKVVAADGVEISREEELKVEDIFFGKKYRKAPWEKVGQVQRMPGIIDEYVEAIMSHVDVEGIRKRKFKVVVDPGNGVGALAAPKLLSLLGCEVLAINSNVDGRFPGREPEPTKKSLRHLAEVVKATGADLGVGYDGDADRAIFVDERGEVHWGDKSLAIVEKYYFMEHPGETIVTPVSSSQIVKEIADMYGGKVFWTKVGSVVVSRVMVEKGYSLGGEENGGIMYGPHQPVRDGAMTTALMLDIMQRTGKKLSELVEELPRFYGDKDKVFCPNERKAEVLERLREEVSGHGVKIETIDGVKIWFEDSSWVLMRPSGTEPIYRIYAEAKDPERLASIMREYKALLERLVKTT